MNDRGGAECFRGLAVGVFLTCLVVHGCSGSSTPICVDTPLDPTHEKLMKIGMAYVRFSSSRRRPPQSWADLQPILAETESAGEPWRSARDAQPLVVCWGVDLSKPPAWAKTTPVLAYEKKGAEGSRYVLTAVRSVELMSDKDFRAASFPPGHDPGF